MAPAMIEAASIKDVIVVGAGVMGEGIAQCFAEAGFHVNLVDIDIDACQRCIRQIEQNLLLNEEYGLLSEAPSEILTRIASADFKNVDFAEISCDLAIEAAPELLDVKRSIFATLDALPSTVLLATNTSSFTVSQIAGGMNTPERVVGLHFFNPAHIIPAVEVHGGRETVPVALRIASTLMKRIGKVPIEVRKEVPGFVINRLTGALSREIDYLLDEGVVGIEELDAAVKASLGFRLASIGPMEAEDFIGLDTDARVSKNLFPQLSNREQPSALLLEKVERGDFGVKTGRGWFDYSGKSRESLLLERNRKLIEQLRLFQANARRGENAAPGTREKAES